MEKSSRSPDSLAIDTSLLLLVLAYECLRETGASALERGQVLTDVRGRDDGLLDERFDDLWRVFERASRRIVTQHVVAEMWGSRGRMGRLQHQKALVWQAVARLLQEFSIEEQPCSISELRGRPDYRKMLEAIGPTDAGLIYTAERMRATIISDDADLWHWAGVRQAPAFGMHDINQIWQVR